MFWFAFAAILHHLSRDDTRAKLVVESLAGRIFYTEQPGADSQMIQGVCVGCNTHSVV